MGGVELKSHQVEAANFITTHGSCIIADEMGLGKTFSAIASVYEYYEKQHKKMKTLVVVPASLKATWIYEGLIKFGISKNDIKEIISPSKTNVSNLKQWFTVVSYEGFTRLYNDLAKIKWDFVFFDEAHYLKNKTSARTKAALDFRKLLPRADFVSMTGTPITGKLSDLVPLLLLSKIDKDDLKQFEELASKTDYKKTPKELAKEDRFIKYDAIHNLLKQYMLRRRKEDVLSLPEKMRRLVWLTMTQQEEKDYKNVFSDYVRTTGKNYSKSRGLVETLKWRQFASLLKAKKIKSFVEMLLEKNLKVILFCSFRDTIEILHDLFENESVIIDGSKTHQQKQSAQELFKRYGKDIIIANIKAGGTGFNWTEASDTIFLDLDWVPSNQWQAEDRTHRIGQVDPVYIYYFVLAGTVEQEIMLNKLDEKETVISKVLNEPSEMSKIKVVTQKELVDEIKKRKTKNKKPALDFEAIKKEFIRITEEYTKSSLEYKHIKRLREGNYSGL
jgi:SNF2 family DNA or RNA helicase